MPPHVRDFSFPEGGGAICFVEFEILYIKTENYRSIYAIGDIHGCSRGLKGLLDYIQPNSDDLVITLGDYIDRGEDSRGVIEMLRNLAKTTNLIGIRGNHEQMLLNVLDGSMKAKPWLEYGGKQTLASYGKSQAKNFLPQEHLEFLHCLTDYVETEAFILTHASYEPNLPFDQQSPQLLRWEHLQSAIPAPHMSGKTVVVGHTPNFEGEVLDLGHLICLDTYCHGGGWLSVMELRSRAVWQFSQWGKRRNQGGFLAR